MWVTYRVPRYIKHTVWRYVPVNIFYNLINRDLNLFTTTFMWGKDWILGCMTKTVQTWATWVASVYWNIVVINLNKFLSTDNAIFPHILPKESETTGNDVPVSVQKSYCEVQLYMIINSYSIIPGWNLCIHYAKFTLVAPEQIRFWSTLIVLTWISTYCSVTMGCVYAYGTWLIICSLFRAVFSWRLFWWNAYQNEVVHL